MFVEMYILKKVEDRFQKMGKRFFFFFIHISMDNCEKQIWENTGTVAVSSSIRVHVVLRVLLVFT